MKPEELLRNAQVPEALHALQENVRDNPADPDLRMSLFQLLSVMGSWDRALTQLNVVGDMCQEGSTFALVYRPLVAAEPLRQEVFMGIRTPLIFGEPDAWLSKLVEAVSLAAREKWEEAASLRDAAFEEAPAVPGEINDEPFEWVSDADNRLGPVLEVFLQGAYYWVPVSRIKTVAMEKPSALCDVVWAPAKFTWSNGGEAMGHIPVRYPGIDAGTAGMLQLARRTEWIESPKGGFYTGMGQRMLTTDRGDYSLLDIRRMNITAAG